jgi:hypothetical protein
MVRDFADKSAARQWVWDRLGAEGVRVFRSRRTAVSRISRVPRWRPHDLLDIEPWKTATAIKVNPDSRAPVQMADGSLIDRARGTPQGGVVAP